MNHFKFYLGLFIILFVVDVCEMLVTMYEGGMDYVDGFYRKKLYIKLQNKGLASLWLMLFAFDLDHLILFRDFQYLGHGVVLVLMIPR